MIEIILVIGFITLAIILSNGIKGILAQLVDNSKFNRAKYDRLKVLEEEIRVIRELLEFVESDKLEETEKDILEGKDEQTAELIRLAVNTGRLNKKDRYYDYASSKALAEVTENSVDEGIEQILSIETKSRAEVKEQIFQERAKQKTLYNESIERMNQIVKNKK